MISFLFGYHDAKVGSTRVFLAPIWASKHARHKMWISLLARIGILVRRKSSLFQETQHPLFSCSYLLNGRLLLVFSLHHPEIKPQIK